MYKKIARTSSLLLTGLLFISLSGFSYGSNAHPVRNDNPRPNVLMIMVDDLRPDIGCYGNIDVKTPNIDRLAAKAVVFKRQFVTVPTCGASRASFITGMLPRNTNDLSNEAFGFKQAARTSNDPESFVHHLRNHGYYTVGIGKVSHSPDGYVYNYNQKRSNQLELPKSWDEMLFNAGKWDTGWNAFFGYADGSNRNNQNGSVRPYENKTVDDEGYPDGLTALLAIEKIQRLKDKQQPFFMGIGFFKPHLPFNAPQKYWDLYDREKLVLSPSNTIPYHVNTASLHNSDEFNRYRLGEEKVSLSKPVSDEYARKLRHAYYAGVSYVDAQIGKVLDELEKSGLDENTIVVLWGDHGWHLGDNRVWGKHTLSDWALRSPLIIKLAGDGRKGAVSEKIVSSIDVYPTLMELCNIKMPYKADGTSLVPLLKDPNSAVWKNVAYSYFRRGISMRNDRYRFTRYFRNEKPLDELYDHVADPFGNSNIAVNNSKLIEELLPTWKEGDTKLYIK